MVTLVVLAFGVIALGVWIRANVAEFDSVSARHSPSSALLRVLASDRRWRLASGRFASRRSGSCSARFGSSSQPATCLLVQAAESLATVVHQPRWNRDTAGAPRLHPPR